MRSSSNRHSRSVKARARDRISAALIDQASVQHRLGEGEGSVALTFDDGPDPQFTGMILDELARLSATATFFLVGQSARSHPELVRRMLADGHAVGSHSEHHPDPWKLNARDLVAEYRRGRASVEHAARRPVRLFRPPKGYVDTRGAVAMLAARVRPWLWTIDTHDWEPGASAHEIVGRLSDLRAGDVVLMHDAIRGPLAPSARDRSATLQALPAIVEMVKDRDLRFATLR